MDFRLVLEKLLAAFEEHGVRYALMGGLALGAWGVPRGTVDIDFLVLKDDLEKIDTIMRSLGYELRYRSENVSQFLSPVKIFGEVDYLHAFRSPSLGMLKRAQVRKLFGEFLDVRFLKIEDVIGMKVQAIANNENRKAVDMADIEALLSLHGAAVDWNLIGEYFALFGFSGIFGDLRRKYGDAE